MYEDLIKSLRATRKLIQYSSVSKDCEDAADAIEELQKKFVAEHKLRVAALDRLCEWCAICPIDKRNATDCEIANLLDSQNTEEGE